VFRLCTAIFGCLSKEQFHVVGQGNEIRIPRELYTISLLLFITTRLNRGEVNLRRQRELRTIVEEQKQRERIILEK
jgi:hypothetical protein